ncbi:MAG TPA: hypothetical protein VNF46_06520 [Gammaproteobacteria bacterium]|nr:hypothetical protein [Gammaproteobacteria bacterium]
MSNIVPYTMQEAGRIPGIDGYFAAGQTVFVDVEVYRVLRIEQPQDADRAANSLVEAQDSTNQQFAIVSPATAESNGG